MNEYNFFLRVMRWLRRFRKRCGYGVHSPFAFDFITGVVYSNDIYYAYARLRQPLVASIARLDEYDPISGLTAKDLRLLFRIANWAEPARLHLYGASPTVEAYIQAARPTAACHPSAAGPTLIYLDSTDYIDNAANAAGIGSKDRSAGDGPYIGPGDTLIVRGIHADNAARQRWEQLKASEGSPVSFDLGRFGVIVSRAKINRQDYIVNYF